jgi:hypothetical protein
MKLQGEREKKSASPPGEKDGRGGAKVILIVVRSHCGL